MKEQRNISDVSNDLQVSDTSADTDINEVLEPKEKVSKHGSKWKEEPGELDRSHSQLRKIPFLVGSITTRVCGKYCKFLLFATLQLNHISVS